MTTIMDRIRAGEEVTIAFLGDSITQGCFEGDASEKDEQFVYHSRFIRMLEEKYPNAKIHKINAGIGGNTAGMGLFRMQTDVIEETPDFCVVCFGLNDTPFCALKPFLKWIPFVKKMFDAMGPFMDAHALELLRDCRGKEAYEYSMSAILEQLEKKHIPAMVMLPNRMSTEQIEDKNDSAYFLSGINAKMVKNGTMDQVMDIARKVAKEHNVPVADAYTRWKELEEQGVVTNGTYVNGTNHPSRELHQELAKVLYQAFEEL